MNKIKVFVVDDDVNWLKEMKKLLNTQKDILVAGTATNREDAVQIVKNNDIDVVIMDINLSENKCDGIYAALEISEFKKAKIIMLTSLNEEELIADSFNAGAVNFISKENYNEIPNAIRLSYYNSSPIEVILKDYLKLKEKEQLELLTPVEKEIFSLLEEGYTQSRMEKELFKTTSTIKKQIGNILGKLGTKNSRDAVRKVKTRGLQKYK